MEVYEYDLIFVRLEFARWLLVLDPKSLMGMSAQANGVVISEMHWEHELGLVVRLLVC